MKSIHSNRFKEYCILEGIFIRLEPNTIHTQGDRIQLEPQLATGSAAT